MTSTETFIALVLCPAAVLSQWALGWCLREVGFVLINALELKSLAPRELLLIRCVVDGGRSRDLGTHTTGGVTNDG